MIVQNYLKKSAGQCRREFLIYWQVQLLDPLYVCNMQVINNEVFSSRDEIHDGLYFGFPSFNTRYLFPTEWCLEFDTDHITAIKCCCASILNLINQDYHFCVWYAEGMRSPHIRIYDLLPEDMNEEIKFMARKKFTEAIVPKEYWPYVDWGLMKRHKLCLEFAKHWHYNTHLKLLFEYPLCN